MKHEFKKVTMKDFEEKFDVHYPDGVKRRFHEEGVGMWLYYDKDTRDRDDVSKLTDEELLERINTGPKHVGTWQSGDGWLK